MSNENNVDFNITPEMINNLINRLNLDKSNENTSSNVDSTTSNDKIIENIENQNNSNEGTTNSFDFETILKIKNILETLNKKDDPRSNLLYSLKPYLRESKKKKLDQYVNLLKFTDITGIFKMSKGDINK